MISMIAPAFVLPSLGPSPNRWEEYDGSHDGAWTEILPNSANFFGAGCVVDKNDSSRGVVFGTGNGLRMFSISSLTSVATLGSAAAGVADNHMGDFASSNNRIWLPAATGEWYLGEFDGTGMTGSQGPSDDVSSQTAFVPCMTEIDASRALWSIPSSHATNAFMVGIAQRSGATQVSTVNTVSMGSTDGDTDNPLTGCARPLNGTEGLAIHLQENFTATPNDNNNLLAQGIAHAGTTPSAAGVPTTVTETSVRGTTNHCPWLSRCVDGFGAADGRFIATWLDNSTVTIHAVVIRYDGSTISLGTELDTGLALDGVTVFVEDLGGGVAVVASADGAGGSGGFFFLNYNQLNKSDLSLELGGAGGQSIPLDGDAAGDTLTRYYVSRISSNRFLLSAVNQTDGAVDVRVFHNGGDG